MLVRSHLEQLPQVVRIALEKHQSTTYVNFDRFVIAWCPCGARDTPVVPSSHLSSLPLNLDMKVFASVLRKRPTGFHFSSLISN